MAHNKEGHVTVAVIRFTHLDTDRIRGASPPLSAAMPVCGKNEVPRTRRSYLYGHAFVMIISVASCCMSVRQVNHNLISTTKLRHRVSTTVDFQQRPLVAQLSQEDLSTSIRLFSANTSHHAIEDFQDHYGYWANRTIVEGCAPSTEWRDKHHPSCLIFHEIELLPNSTLVASGSSRDAWEVLEYDGNRIALKTTRAFSNFEPFDLQARQTIQREAVISSELTFSPYIADINGYCATSALAAFADASNMPSAYQKPILGRIELLKVARDMAMGLSHLHNVSVQWKAKHCEYISKIHTVFSSHCSRL